MGVWSLQYSGGVPCDWLCESYVRGKDSSCLAPALQSRGNINMSLAAEVLDYSQCIQQCVLKCKYTDVLNVRSISCRGCSVYPLWGPERGVPPERLWVAVYGDSYEPCVKTVVLWSGMKTISVDQNFCSCSVRDNHQVICIRGADSALWFFDCGYTLCLRSVEFIVMLLHLIAFHCTSITCSIYF